MENIKALFTFEILGRPPEHIKETMGQLIDKLGELPGITINRKDIHEPKPIKDENSRDLFTTFSEVEVVGKDMESIITIVFHAMPSHIEIIEPSEFGFRNFDFTNLLSALTVKLHRYDEIAKSITMERNILINRVKEMQARLNELEKGEKQLEEKIETKIKNKKPEIKKTAKKKIVKSKASKKPKKK